MNRVPVRPELFRWARERSGLSQEILLKKFNRLPQWEAGDSSPTLRQLEEFANTVHVPIGYLFLSEPPAAENPIADFRTAAGQPVDRPSPNLLDTVYSCLNRQTWYRDFSVSLGKQELGFVGSASMNDSPQIVAAEMRDLLDFSPEKRQQSRTGDEGFRELILKAEAVGVLVMVSGIVGSNTHRHLDVSEFRGFALSDPFAPLVFINGRDSKAAKMFTLAHELAHIWLGKSALSNPKIRQEPKLRREEVWCNSVAAEFLVPLESLQLELTPGESLEDQIARLAKKFKVSHLVILRRLLDAEQISQKEFDAKWALEQNRSQNLNHPARSRGGDFNRTTISRVGRRFATALIESTLEGQTLYGDAFRMLGISRTATFNKLAETIGIN